MIVKSYAFICMRDPLASIQLVTKASYSYDGVYMLRFSWVYHSLLIPLDVYTFYKKRVKGLNGSVYT
jgi:hypothetical protein